MKKLIIIFSLFASLPSTAINLSNSILTMADIALYMKEFMEPKTNFFANEKFIRKLQNINTFFIDNQHCKMNEKCHSLIPEVISPICARAVIKTLNINNFKNNHKFINLLLSERKSFSCLTELDLSFNSLRVIPNEVYLIYQLKVLKLHFNNIKNVGERISNLINLELFVLDNNEIIDLPVSICQLSKIKLISLLDNDTVINNNIKTHFEKIGCKVISHQDLTESIEDSTEILEQNSEEIEKTESLEQSDQEIFSMDMDDEESSQD